jgi:hypothetical protein
MTATITTTNKITSKIELHRQNSAASGNARVEAPAKSRNGNAVEFAKAPEVKRSAPTADSSSLSGESAKLASADQLHSALTEMLGPKAEVQAASSDAPMSEADVAKFKKPADDSLLDDGFNRDKINNPDKYAPHDSGSVKYKFARVAMNYKLDSVKDSKGTSEELLKAMTGDLKKAGIEVVGVSGDRIQVKTEAGYEWVDVIKNAGSDKPQFWWGSEAVGTQEPTKTVQEWEAKTGAGSAAAAAGGAAGGAAAAGAVDNGPKVLGGQIDSGKVMAILKKYPATGQGLTSAVSDPELQKLYPGVMTFGGVKDGKAFNANDRLSKGLNVDKLFFPNGAIVDVIGGAGAAGAKWAWMPEN